MQLLVPLLNIWGIAREKVMSRRVEWKKSAPGLVRLKRGSPGRWQFYFPGFRSVPAQLWEVERWGGFAYRITKSGVGLASEQRTLARVREYIASRYEFLPANS